MDVGGLGLLAQVQVLVDMSGKNSLAHGNLRNWGKIGKERGDAY
jgi:hypothetical protein